MFPAVFIAILARTIREPWQWAVAGVAAAVALAVKGTLGGSWHIALAGLGASALGIWLAPRGTPSGRGSQAPADDSSHPAAPG